MAKKTINNTDVKGTKKQVPDVEIFGNGDMFKLLSKASSKKEKWMKSTKAMEVDGGCVVQVTTQQDSNIAEALCFVPGVKIQEEFNADGIVISRELVAASVSKSDKIKKFTDKLKASKISTVKLPFITKVKI